ncbi:unnamed protein product [Calicophoron daubneyi]
MTHVYSRSDTHVCMERLSASEDTTRIYFIGDSRLLTLFNAFSRHMDENWKLQWNRSGDTGNVSGNRYSAPILLKGTRSVLCFFHHEEVTTRTLYLLDGWSSTQEGRPSPQGSANELPKNETNEEKDSRSRNLCLKLPPAHLVIGMGTKTIERFNHSEAGLLAYQKNLEELAGALTPIKFMRTLWMLQDPVAEGLLSGRHRTTTNKEIDYYNSVAQKVMRSVPGLEIWQSNRLIAKQMGFPAVSWRCLEPAEPLIKPVNASTVVNSTGTVADPTVPCAHPPPLSDGFHVSDEAMTQNVQILLNYYCNNQMKFEDGTCCRSPEPITAVQKRCFLFIGLCLSATILCFIYDTLVRPKTSLCQCSKKFWRRKRHASSVTDSANSPPVHLNAIPKKDCNSVNSCDSSSTSTFEDFYELVRILTEFGLILVYFFVCDRTVLFMKTNKGFTVMSFFLPLIYFLILGLFFSGVTEETKLNHVDITREWKGWMQVYFLIYHFTGSYRIVPLFSFTRFLVSAYLFLSGFGHFYYMWHRPVPASIVCKLIPFRFSSRDLFAAGRAWWMILHRYLDVMYRMNFFVLGLCLVMNRSYMFYYFMPLVSFWFTVLMLVFTIFPRVSGVATSDSEGQQKHVRLNSELFDSVNCTSSFPNLALSSSSESQRFHSSLLSVSPREQICSSPTSPKQSKRADFLDDLRSNLRISQSSSSIDWRCHQKALSVGTGFDFCREPEPQSLRGSRLHSCGVAGAKWGPPWTERLMRNFRAVVPMHPRRRMGILSSGKTVRAVNRCCCCNLRLTDLVIVIKLVLVIVGVELLYRSASYFHLIFFSGPQKHLFEQGPTAPNSMEPYGDNTLRGEYAWFYRWSVDRFSVIYGMIFALLCEWGRRIRCLSDSTADDLGFPGSRKKYEKLKDSYPNLILPSSLPEQNEKGVPVKFVYREVAELSSSPPYNSTLNDADTPTTSSASIIRPATDPDLSSHRSPTAFEFSGVTTYPPQFPTAPFRTLGPGYGVLAKITCRRLMAIMLTIMGLIGIGLSILFALKCANRQLCAEIHAFLCLLPILSYILARNSLGLFRRNYSTLFAWVGDISLELCIAQHHIWLSADGNGILVLLPGYPLLNLALTSFVFVCVCHEIHILTKRLRRFIVPNSAFQLVRNVLIFGTVFYQIISPKLHSSE